MVDNSATWDGLSHAEKAPKILEMNRKNARGQFTHQFLSDWIINHCVSDPMACITAFAFGLALVDSLLLAASKKGSCQCDVFDILCVRPFREYTMDSGILLKKGSELGNTFRGWADFQLTDNIIAKTHIGHFTFWHASIVTNPKCLFLAEDIFCTNYIRGEGRCH